MNPYMTQTPNANDVALVESIVSQRLKGSILWMVVGLLTTLGIGIATLMNPSWARFAASNFNILLIVEVAVVFLFSMRTYKANVMSLYAMFFIYSALNGVTLSLVSLAYGIMEATVPALIGALAFFVAFSIVGLTTKKNLAGLT
ncbi:MAG: BAX inhibitor (BI)-1/YccA family protein, partial [Veillonella atypica]|nr:BAX inhibitor (BI)-1/YccA family protein [Veillonella atypica]